MDWGLQLIILIYSNIKKAVYEIMTWSTKKATALLLRPEQKQRNNNNSLTNYK